MDPFPGLLQELEESVSHGTPDSRERALWHATDLLIAGRYTEEQIWIFGAVIERLASEIELTARARLADKLAQTDNAPLSIISKLASDKSITVAGNVLRHSKRLDVRTLVAQANSQGQQHLMAISKRTSLCEAVTDVLVVRGNREVVHSVAANDGAQFSEAGFLTLVKRSEDDSILTHMLGRRIDIPRHVFQQLIAKASAEVKQKLKSERPDLTSEIQESVTDVTGSIHATFGPASAKYFAAKKAVSLLHRDGKLDEARICAYAQQLKLEETAIGLSLLCSIPVNVAERALDDQTGEMTLILASALDYSWDTAMALLFLGASEGRIFAGKLDELKSAFARLKPQTSRSVLQLYHTRKQATAQDAAAKARTR
jgi:uncharacterized protein (DUF2336 family)